jgi:hypothetical protein
MDDRIYHIKISPENIKGDIFKVIYDAGTFIPESFNDECCEITTSTTTKKLTGSTYVYSALTDVLSGGTNGISLLTGLTIPILLTESSVDIGYYSTFDGLILQKDVMTNFLFSGDVAFPNVINFYNTSDVELKKYLSFSNYQIDWGDGVIQTVNNTSPTPYTHTYPSPNTYSISMSGMSPWGYNVIKKQITIPYTNVQITNPNGTAVFYPLGGNWSATPISYDYIFSGDSECELPDPYYDNFGTVPFLVTGYTQSTLNDLEVYGPKSNLFAEKFKLGQIVTGTSGVVGIVFGPSIDNTYTAYSINNITYFDYSGGTTVFMVESSGLTSDMLVCSALTKNEVLLNVIDEAEIQSDVYIERGKNSVFESIQRLGEVDNLGDLEKYGYGFFNVINQS